MGKKRATLRVYLTGEDRERIDRLMEEYGCGTDSCCYRIAIDRCQRDYPDEDHVTLSFRRNCAWALDELNPHTVLQGKPTQFDVGQNYRDYLNEMSGPLGFNDAGKMLRGLILLWDSGML